MTRVADLKSQVRNLCGFDDAALARLPSTCVFATPQWQQAWWDIFGRGKLLLTLVEETARPLAFAPLFADGGMIYFVGSGGSDYLDFAGDISGDRLPCLLLAASEQVDDFEGFVFYHVPDASPTASHLHSAAKQLGWRIFDEGEQLAPAMDLVANPQQALDATRKKSLVRHEKSLRKAGAMRVHHFRTGSEIRPQLETFFHQHISRWAATEHPSLFLDPKNRAFYHRLCDLAGDSAYLRFTRVDLDARPVAFHFGFCYRGVYMWYKPTFDIALAKFSPGEVLLRQLLLTAIEENARFFDFGLGDEAFKGRFATHVNKVRNWGLYPPEKK